MGEKITFFGRFVTKNVCFVCCSRMTFFLFSCITDVCSCLNRESFGLGRKETSCCMLDGYVVFFQNSDSFHREIIRVLSSTFFDLNFYFFLVSACLLCSDSVKERRQCLALEDGKVLRVFISPLVLTISIVWMEQENFKYPRAVKLGAICRHSE